MNNISAIPNLSFFTVTEYKHITDNVCDFTNIPRPHYCMGLVLRGCADFIFKNQKVTVNEGDLIFVPVGSKYISKWSGNPDIHYISIHFSFEFNRAVFKNAIIPIQKIATTQLHDLAIIYKELFEAYENNNLVLALGHFYNILSKVYPLIVYKEKTSIDSRIETAIQYIEQHCREKLEIESLAKSVNMSPSRFYTLFKKTTNQSPIDFKNTYCIRNAQLLLISEKDKSIEEISEMAGFNSSIYFRKLFKKTTGKTPTEYRSLGKNQE